MYMVLEGKRGRKRGSTMPPPTELEEEKRSQATFHGTAGRKKNGKPVIGRPREEEKGEGFG